MTQAGTEKQVRKNVAIPPAAFSELARQVQKNHGLIVPEGLKNQMLDETSVVEDESSFEFIHSSDEPQEKTAVDFLNMLFVMAHKEKWSDIHFQGIRQGFLIRSRNRSGDLEPKFLIKKEFMRIIDTKIRAKCSLPLGDKERMYDGSFSLLDKTTNNLIDVRVSLVPTKYGQNIVCRLLTGDEFNYEKLEIAPYAREAVNEAISREYGLILVSGPTGSGKSTTLYSILSKLNNGSNNIMTAEDPIEKNIPGANQVQVTRERTFAGILRSFLRQDPNIIMVGELRDKETAEMALHASNTGHLVFSTIHTNSAAEIITRLSGMGVNGYVIANSLLLFTAQRLMRRLCPYCKETRAVDEKLLKKLPTRFKAKNGLYNFIGKGCLHCQNKGYRGKVPVMEVGVNDKKMRHMIENNATISEVKKVLEEQVQYRTLFEEALLMSEEGKVDFNEAMMYAEIAADEKTEKGVRDD